MSGRQEAFHRWVAALRHVITTPSSSTALFVGVTMLIVSSQLLNDLMSIPLDSHFWLAEGVLALDPLRLALGGYWLLLWTTGVQMALVSAKALNKASL